MELKFRAWDNDLKYMFTIGDMPDLVIGFDGHIYDKGCAFTSQIKCISANITLMQFTGLTDNTDKDFYIGDIGEFENGDRFVLKAEDCLEVYVDWIGEPKCEDQARDLYRITRAKVIGNIHQHSHLLGGNNNDT